MLMGLAFIPCVVLLYALSIGPVVYLYRASGEKPAIERAIKVLYAPIEWAYHNTPAHDPIRWYVELWH